jgi:glycosyltransferase involved in cell wall biosynthesis
MIVRNESAIIERCLDSVVGLADSYVIVDTGSTDNTVELIKAHALSGELHERPWVNFGVNRSQALELAHGQADYLLLLDADMTVWWAEPLPELTADQYMIRVPGPVEYRLAALVRGDRRWRSVGAAHENIAGDGYIDRRPLDGIVVHHHCDGSRRPNKFIEDLQLLVDEAAREPDNPRTQFYLANTLRDLGEKQRAAKTYRHRAAMGGWDEEVFYALFQAAVLDDDITGLFDAWSYRPSRAEPLYEIAWRLRHRGAHAAAKLVADEGRRIPMPDDILFVWRWVYRWGLLFEYALAEHQIGYHQLADRAYGELLQTADLPDGYRAQIEKNRRLLFKSSYLKPKAKVPSADRG